MAEKRPNIVFILADQHNAKVLGHKGHPDVKTPHLDRLASGWCDRVPLEQEPPEGSAPARMVSARDVS